MSSVLNQRQSAIKSRIQECKYHSQIRDIAHQYRHCGKLWSERDMKRLLIDQFERDTRNDPDFKDQWDAMESVELAPSLDGAGVVTLGVQSRKFTPQLASAFVDWLYAFGAEHEMVFRK